MSLQSQRSHERSSLTRRRACIAICAAWVAIASLPIMGATLRGVVTRVSDGDTLWLRPATGGKPMKLRLRGVDAPELCQAGGPQSRQALEAMVQGRTVEVETHGRDDYGRWLGTLRAGDADVGSRMVREGQAWSYRYRQDPGPYQAEEAAARHAGMGLHATAGAMRPRDFRERHGPCTTAEP